MSEDWNYVSSGKNVVIFYQVITHVLCEEQEYLVLLLLLL